MVTLRDYQETEFRKIVKLLLEAKGPPIRTMRVAPTGSGKGTLKLALAGSLNKLSKQVSKGPVPIITPSLEIIRGFLRRLGVSPGTRSKEVTSAEGLNIWTPVRYLNRLEAGRLPLPWALLIDEAHEWVRGNKLTDRLLREAPNAHWIGYTATAYRGTMAGTAALRELWGEPCVILELQRAASRGYFIVPEFEVKPLIDDDNIRVSLTGDFDANATSEYWLQHRRLDRLADLIQEEYRAGRKIVVSVSNRHMGVELLTCLGMRGCPSHLIEQGTSDENRRRAYNLSETQRDVLLQISVLYRGSDFPWLDTYIDSQPTMSPTRWMQSIGRITRPAEGKLPRVIVTNRNFERHGYLFGGVIPIAVRAKCEQQWPDVSARAMTQWLGFERTRKAHELYGADGRRVLWYRFTKKGAYNRLRDYGALVVPSSRFVQWGTRERKPARKGRWTYPRWKICDKPTSIKGMKSGDTRPPNAMQISRWHSMIGDLGISGPCLYAEQSWALDFMKHLRIRITDTRT